MVRKNQLFVISILFILVLSLTFTSAITGGIGNAKMILRPEVNGWTNTIIEKSILVINKNDVPINVTLEVAEDSTGFLELIDDFYVLQPNTEERARFIVKVRKEGTYNGRINVFFRHATNEKEAGVALASEIIVIAKKDHGYEEIDDEEVEDDENENNSTITGDVIGNIKDLNINPTAIIIGSSLVLLIVLLILLSVMVKKNKKKRKVNGNKKK